MTVDLKQILDKMTLSELEQDCSALEQMLEQIDTLVGRIASITASCQEICSQEGQQNNYELARVAQNLYESATMVGLAAYSALSELVSRRFAATELFKRMDDAKRSLERKRAKQQSVESPQSTSSKT